MKLRNSTLTGWILAASICLAFFIPWARFAPEQLGRNALDLAGELAGDDAGFVESYLLMRKTEWNAIWHNPGEGLSAYQLVLLSEKDSVSATVSKACMKMFWGENASEHSIKFLAFGPLMALLGAIALSMKRAHPRFLMLAALGQLLFYGFLRWKLNQTLGDRLLWQIEFNLGLWLTLYATALLCLLQLVKALQPKSRW
jgi:hypothetical protein